jgi:hypothetical protein
LVYLVHDKKFIKGSAVICFRVQIPVFDGVEPILFRQKLKLRRVRKFMNPEESRQSAELNSYHGDINPGFSTGFCALVVADQAPVAHQPAKGSLYNPPTGVIGKMPDPEVWNPE